MYKRALLTGIATLFLATGAVHAGGVDMKRGKCYMYTSDHHPFPCSSFYGKDWRKKMKEERNLRPQCVETKEIDGIITFVNVPCKEEKK